MTSIFTYFSFFMLIGKRQKNVMENLIEERKGMKKKWLVPPWGAGEENSL